MRKKDRRQVVLLFVLILSQSLFSSGKLSMGVPQPEVLAPAEPPAAPPPPPPGGPSQPEVQTFMPADVTQNVNLFTGDFNYNIPLLDVGGYPVNIFYQQGVGMEDQASMVGLGWNLSVGAVNRSVRGLPDDFNGDEIEYKQYQKPSWTMGLDGSISPEIFSFRLGGGKLGTGLGVDLGIKYNNYNGFVTSLSLSPSLSYTNSVRGKLGATLGLNSDDGAYISPNLSLDYRWLGREEKTSHGIGINFGAKISSSEGLESMSYGAKYDNNIERNSSVMNFLSKNANGNDVSVHSGYSFHQNCRLAPFARIPMANWGVTLGYGMGPEGQGVFGKWGVSGNFSRQYLSTNSKSFAAYGYLNAQNAGDGEILHDFQRENDGGVDNKVPNLPVTNFTYDLYNATGEGMSGQFRAHRNDVGIVHDPGSYSVPGGDASVGVEVGGGALLKVGVDLGATVSTVQEGKWKDGNAVLDLCKFDLPVEPLREYAYFKQVGEFTDFDASVYNRTLHDKACNFQIAHGYLYNKLKTNTTESSDLATDPLMYANRAKRNILFTVLTGKEATIAGLEKKIISHSSFGQPVREDEIDRFDNTTHTTHPRRKQHHISEVTITKDDGVRYIYGIPAYNVIQKNISFNISNCMDDVNYYPFNAQNLIKYTNDNINGPRTYANYKDKNCGLDNSYSEAITPPYAHAYLLTAIVSADYVDFTGDGPSADDNGTYTKFNYQKTNDAYRWRAPYFSASASYQPMTNYLNGKINTPNEDAQGDDMASFTYGEKEIWLVKSIETKNYEARFYYSERQDGHGVLGTDGGASLFESGQALQKLDSIKLFAREALSVSNADPSAIKTVHFVYDYSLCKGTPDNGASYDHGQYQYPVDPSIATNSHPNSGKLTLKNIYFTYENSYKGELSYYSFKYADSLNFNYNYTGNNRWGGYKPAINEIAALDNVDFPYVNQQDKDNKIQRYAAAWSLSEIKSPANGVMKIYYESDDYAFVQDKQAMQMVGVVGLGANKDHLNSPPSGDLQGNDYLFFTIPKRKLTDNAGELLKNMVGSISELYYKFNTKVTNEENYEDITGFINLKKDTAAPLVYEQDYGVYSGDDNVGWIHIKRERNGFHAPTRSAIRFVQEHLPKVAKGQMDHITGDDFSSIMSQLGASLKSMFTRLNEISQGGEGWVYNNGVGRYIRPGYSYIRLNNPYHCKYGGGARVSKITITDNWDAMADGALPKTYGVKYNYSIMDTTLDKSGRPVSSGVASFEPEVGNDENPFYLPMRIRDYNDPKYRRVVQPVGSSLFPAAGVGYSKVTVTALQNQDVKRAATGKTEHTFFTARDFPVKVESTNADVDYDEPDPASQLLLSFLPFSFSEQLLTASQGHCIKLNDMHGKPRGTYIYSQGVDVAATGTEYFYKTDPLYPNQLSSEVTFIDTNGESRTGLAGFDYDFTIDTRYSKQETWAPKIEINTDVIWAFIPIPFPMPIPGLSYTSIGVRTVGTTKTIHQTGILDSVVAFDNGMRVATINKAYDSETGALLLTETQNEFDDKVYDLKIPAHWVHCGMGQAYKNQGAQVNVTVPVGSTINSGWMPIPGTENHFCKGDEVLIRDADKDTFFTVKYWVLDVHFSPSEIQLIDRNGMPFRFAADRSTTKFSIKVLRSGNRNMAAVEVGSLSMQKNPLETGKLNSIAWNQAKVINGSAVEYDDRWQCYRQQKVSRVGTCNCAQLSSNEDAMITLLRFATEHSGNHNLNLHDAHFDHVPAGITPFSTPAGLSITTEMFSDNDIELVVNGSCYISITAGMGTSLIGNIIDISLAGRNIASEDCMDRDDLPLTITFSTPGSNIDTSIVTVWHVTALCRTSCLKFVDCTSPPAAYLNNACDIYPGLAVNPYVEGIRGNYRPRATYTYAGDRLNTSIVRTSGFYDAAFRPFWTCNAFKDSSSTANWIAPAIATKIDPHGKTLETKDALDIYSANLYGFNRNFVIASAQNSHYSDIAFESFEDLWYTTSLARGMCPDIPNLTLNGWAQDILGEFRTDNYGPDTNQSHSGKYSLEVDAGSKRTIDQKILFGEEARDEGAPYPLAAEDIVKVFKPAPGKYLVSGWLKVRLLQVDSTAYTTYNSASISIGEDALRKRSDIINGWQQVWDEIEITEGQPLLSITLTAGSDSTWFDDIRIQPANALMKTYVYNEDYLRLDAILDENNFATFFQYDEEGALARVKKETERGIMTVQEIRFGNAKADRRP